MQQLPFSLFRESPVDLDVLHDVARTFAEVALRATGLMDVGDSMGFVAQVRGRVVPVLSFDDVAKAGVAKAGAVRAVFRQSEGTSVSVIVAQPDAPHRWARVVTHIKREEFSDFIVVDAQRSEKASAASIKALDELFNKNAYTAPPRKNNSVRMLFLFPGKNGMTGVHRDLVCPEWEAIKDNYPKATQDGVEELDLDNASGKLWLLVGPPGTGKTYSLRALARSVWRDEGRHIVVLSSVIKALDNEADFIKYVLDATGSIAGTGLVFILEDIPSSMLAGRDKPVAEVFAKLLNLTDGLLGQGLNIRFVATTNEAVDVLDPALRRHGRLGGIINYTVFPKAEAVAWLKANGIAEPNVTAETMSLADMYGVLGQAGIVIHSVDDDQDD